MIPFHNMHASISTNKDGEQVFVSYNTPVVKFDGKVFRLGAHCRYSVTTTRQVTRYISETSGERISAAGLDAAMREPDEPVTLDNGVTLMYTPDDSDMNGYVYRTSW